LEFTALLECTFKKTTGLDCPGCGIQRSALALSEGKWIDSFYLFPSLFPLMIAIALIIGFAIFKKNWMYTGFLVFIIIAGVLMMGNWVFKLL